MRTYKEKGNVDTHVDIAAILLTLSISKTLVRARYPDVDAYNFYIDFDCDVIEFV